MKSIKKTNNIVLGIQLALFALGLVNFGFILVAFLFAMITGLVQIILACALLAYEEKRAHVRIYLTAVVIYFVGVFFFNNHLQGPVSLVFSFGVPILLATYISYIINKKDIV